MRFFCNLHFANSYQTVAVRATKMKKQTDSALKNVVRLCGEKIKC